MKSTKRQLLLLEALALAAVPILPAFAQTVPDRPDPAPPASIEQITTATGPVLTAPAAPRTSAPPPQLTSAQDSGQPAQQLTNERQPPQAPGQIYKGKRSAQASTPLSRPADGRTGSVERVDGKDRCDPAANDRREAPDCDNVIETRAAEFERPDSTPLSPEQRIIIAQQLRERAGSAAGAAKLLAMGSLDADSSEGQAVASIMLKPPPEPVKEKEPVDDANAEQQAAAAIVNAIINQAPPAPR